MINIVTKSGTNAVSRFSLVLLSRPVRCKGCRQPSTAAWEKTPPFDREQYAFTLGGPIKKDKAWFFGSVEYRNQDGAALVGVRDLATRTIKTDFRRCAAQ